MDKVHHHESGCALPAIVGGIVDCANGGTWCVIRVSANILTRLIFKNKKQTNNKITNKLGHLKVIYFSIKF
jgi:hypothetical protein